MNDLKKESPFKGKTGVRRLINATGYSLSGFQSAWLHEAAFRQVFFLGIAGMSLSFIFNLPAWGRVAVVLCHFLCITIELINSAIEAAVDHTSLDLHVLAKRAKDMGSAAQLVGLINLGVVWILVLAS